MADDKNLRDQMDRNRVARDENYEVDYLVEKTGASREQVTEAIRAVGNNREKVEEYLKRDE
jgi:hypothetical protein